MGVETKKSSKPPLPAPTDTDDLNSPSTTELATELSRATDKTSYSIPEDGSPITISTRKNRRDRDDSTLTKGNHQSQTSLLIEYFEGSKDGRSESRRPSVRVKVTPSTQKKGRNSNDHIQITESKGTRKPSYTKRISLSPNPRSAGIHDGDLDDRSLSELASNTTGSNVTSRGGGPIEIEVMPKRHGSPLIPTAESNTQYSNINGSDISSMPADSFLDNPSMSPPRRERSRSLSRGEALAAGAATGLAAAAVVDTLHTPTRRRSRSLSRERIAHKAAEKIRSGDKHERRRKHSSSKSRSDSRHSDRHEEGVKSPRRRSSRSHHQEESMVSADSKGESSLLSSQAPHSQVSQRSDGYSYRSGTSKSSGINNPKLLETVEDAIRRLILPELTALKREQSKHASRSRRGSVTSGSGVSRDDGSKVSYRTVTPEATPTRPKVTLNDNEVLSESKPNRLRKSRKSGERLDSESERNFEREASEETVIKDGENVRKKRSGDRHHTTEALAAGAALGALTAAALHKHDSTDDLEKKERRRRRAKSRSRSDISVEELEHSRDEKPPPMPLMSDINASELTRTSILSAETDRPNSASEEARLTPVKEVPRGIATPVSPGARTPTRTPVIRPQSGLGMYHNNFSSSNLTLQSPLNANSPREQRNAEYEIDENGRKVPMGSSHQDEYDEDEDEYDDGYDRPSYAVEAGLVGAAAGAGLAAMHHHNNYDEPEEPDYYRNEQSVPPPLRYVPYSSRRALSPIPQSVVSYREDDTSEIVAPDSKSPKMTRDSHGSYSSLARSAQSNSQLNEHNKHDFPDVRHGGLTDSELTQDGEYWEEQHRENDRNRDMDEESYHTSDPRYNHKHSSYTDSNASMSDLSAGRNIHGVGGGQPDYVHPPDIGVESHVASLVDASVLTGSTGHTGSSGQGRPQFDRRGSYASYEEGSEAHFTSRGNSPTKQQSALSYNEKYENDDGRDTPTRYDEEYDLDENGRKVAMPNYRHKSNIVGPTLVGAAAAAIASGLANKHHRSSEENYVQGPGAPIQKSFADRALESHVPSSPRHSIDRTMSESSQVELGASGVPDIHDPMPEIGYGDNESEVTTNPSIIQGPIGGQSRNRQHWEGRSTPTQGKDSPLHAAEAALVGAAAGAGASAAITEHNRDTGHDHEVEEWIRSDEDKKRDTSGTTGTSYGGMSPVPPGTIERDLLAAGIDPATLTYHSGSPAGPLKDEGYISSAPNPRSAGGITPEGNGKGVDYGQQDPFYQPGMASPAGYDASMGNAMDRIQSKDIVALMDHLTVRDAQRSARDTEILVTLVRSAAEMRNSFEDMKRLLADTEDVIITEVKQNTDRSVQKAINGPRPFPGSAQRSLPPNSQDGMMSDITTKRRNVFRRALKGLSMKSSNDLAKIEQMLVQLLGEVEGLKVAQGLQPHAGNDESYSDISEEEYEKERGYEPEGHAGTSSASHASQSGHFSAPKSRGPSATRPFEGRKLSDHRISTVPEGDEEELSAEEEAVLSNQFEHNELLATPTENIPRGSSAPPPLVTPPQPNIQTNVPVSLSNENTPTTPKTDKSKKHKSSSSSGWIPKISRWSETTVSTVAKGFRSNRSSKQKEQLLSTPPSRSGSAMENYAIDPYGDDKLPNFSADALNYSPNQQSYNHRAISPAAEDPKYKAHRNSINLLHPQPRPGPTHRYQTALENQADSFPQAPSVKSLDWGSSTSINRLPPNANRYANQSPASDFNGALSPPPATQQQAPERPPKEPLDEGNGTPIRRKRLTKQSPLSQSGNGSARSTPDHAYAMSGGNGGYEVGTGAGASPRAGVRLSSGLQAPSGRKPGGPRSMSTGNGSANAFDDTGTVIRRKRDTFGGGGWDAVDRDRVVSAGSMGSIQRSDAGRSGRSFSGESELF